jgi:hypothetical protein
MRTLILLLSTIISIPVFSQQEIDTVYKRCPLYITDTVSANNFFIEALPATIKAERDNGEVKITIQQKEQFFTMFFRDRKLKTGKYKLKTNPGGRDAAAKYSFRSGDQVSYVNVSSGVIEVSYDKVTKLWKLKVNGMIANLVERSVTYYKVRTEFFIRG